MIRILMIHLSFSKDPLAFDKDCLECMQKYKEIGIKSGPLEFFKIHNHKIISDTEEGLYLRSMQRAKEKEIEDQKVFLKEIERQGIEKEKELAEEKFHNAIHEKKRLNEEKEDLAYRYKKPLNVDYKLYNDVNVFTPSSLPFKSHQLQFLDQINKEREKLSENLKEPPLIRRQQMKPLTENSFVNGNYSVPTNLFKIINKYDETENENDEKNLQNPNVNNYDIYSYDKEPDREYNSKYYDILSERIGKSNLPITNSHDKLISRDNLKGHSRSQPKYKKYSTKKRTRTIKWRTIRNKSLKYIDLFVSLFHTVDSSTFKTFVLSQVQKKRFHFKYARFYYTGQVLFIWHFESKN
ncbi:hypothetical protein NUSPORA_02316 [Nucleospora cyclopteri]